MEAVFIGNQGTYDFLRQNIKPDWNWQIPITSIADFWKAMDEEKLSDDTNVIIVSDEFYNQARRSHNEALRDAFLELVFISTQSALTMVVEYYQDKDLIEGDLLKYAGGHQEDGEILHDYWWIDPNRPNPSIDSAIKSYINSNEADPDNVKMIADAENIPMMHYQEEEEPVDDTIEETSWAGIEQPEEQYTNNYGKKARIICVTSTKGGVGKTTTALGGGSWLAASSLQSEEAGTMKARLKVCVVDLDVADAQIGSTIGKASPNILQIAISEEINQDVVAKNLIYSDRMKCWFLLAPKLPTSSDNIPTSKFAETIDTLQYMFDVVILDTSVNYKSQLLSTVAYPKADKILFVTSLDRRAVIGMMKWIIYSGSSKEANGSEIDLGKTCVVVNMSRKGVKMTRKELISSINSSTQRAYSSLDRSINPDDYKTPALIGAVPDIPDGMLMRLSNMQQFQLALGIPPFEGPIGEIFRQLMPKAFQSVLPAVKIEN